VFSFVTSYYFAGAMVEVLLPAFTDVKWLKQKKKVKVKPSLTRGWVCSFQLLLGIASAVFLGLSSTGLMSIIFVSFIERR
jgi:hypothetical protein